WDLHHSTQVSRSRAWDLHHSTQVSRSRAWDLHHSTQVSRNLCGTCTTQRKSPAACVGLAPLDASLPQPAWDLPCTGQILN
ncbi:MAG: hypothetical protein LBG45_04465, partial [Dysgonamonadaceae bacterium]|nr:hypothetical protein [Dysgonamonadaceae bacterium]